MSLLGRDKIPSCPCWNGTRYHLVPRHQAQDARYSVLLLRGNRVVRHVISGAYASSKQEFHLADAELEKLTGQTYDILLHDHQSGRSSTLAKASIPSTQ